MEKLREGRIYTGTVEGYSSEGLGIVRLDGAVVFVPQTIRGETVDIKITKVMKTAAVGEAVKIHAPSPERAKPECPHFGICGGCTFQHMTYTEELWAKRQRVQDALTRLGGAAVPVEEDRRRQGPHPLPQQEPVSRGRGWLHRVFQGPEPSGGAYRALSHPVGDL